MKKTILSVFAVFLTFTTANAGWPPVKGEGQKASPRGTNKHYRGYGKRNVGFSAKQEGTTSEDKQEKTIEDYLAYFSGENIAYADFSKMLAGAANLDEEKQRAACCAYLENTQSSPHFMSQILKQAVTMSNENKAWVYTAYVAHEEAKESNIEKILQEVEGFESETYRSWVFKAYVERLNANEARVQKIRESVEGFEREDCKTWVFPVAGEKDIEVEDIEDEGQSQQKYYDYGSYFEVGGPVPVEE